MKEERSYYLELFLVAFGVILLEINYTRVFSFKLFYYFTYMIVGIALLGMGSGGVVTAISPRLRAVGLSRLVPAACVLAGVSVLLGYFVIALVQVNSSGLPGTLREVEKLLLLALVLFAPFLCAGVVIAAVFSAFPERIHRLYFADLIGAGVACAVCVPLMNLLTPPGAVFSSGLVFLVAALPLAWGNLRGSLVIAAPVAAALLLGSLFPSLLPEPVADQGKTMSPQRAGAAKYHFSAWSPVFRVDVMDSPFDPVGRYVINHDGLIGSTLHRFDGNLASLAEKFHADSRQLPFALVPPDPNVLIIGAAGGHEILASLHFGAQHVTGVELNPVTVSLLTTHFADYTGHIATHERVTLVNDEGRSFLRRDRNHYDLIYFVAPDTYAATNAATSGAYVLSESYLYTSEMIEEALDHLTPDGILCMTFGELDFEERPNRTSRYLSSARLAFERAGIAEFPRHVLVATHPGLVLEAMMLFKRSPFTAAEIEALKGRVARVPFSALRYAWTEPPSAHQTSVIITADDADLARLYREAPYEVGPVTDDAPFFWHFARFSDAIGRAPVGTWVGWDMEDATGERVLMTLLATVVALAAVFLLLPFVAIRDVWRGIPHKGLAALYFAALGTGFMFIEIVLIQKLTLFLGYPTYSLTVTLFALLVFTGVGSLVSARYAERANRALAVLFCALTVLVLFYQAGFGWIAAAWIGSDLGIRIAIAIICLAPLGMCLGAFMPLGLSRIARLTEHKAEYVAWAWAVNGFFSVISSILATILSMTWGFTVVLTLAVLVYLVGIVALTSIPEPA